MTKGALIIIMIYKTNIINNKDVGDENNKNTEHHISQIDFYIVLTLGSRNELYNIHCSPI